MIDYCGCLLTESKNEVFVVHLLAMGKGRWCRVLDVVQRLELSAEVSETTYAVVLDSPDDEENYAFILFHDVDSGETLTAVYNVDYLKNKVSNQFFSLS